MNLLFCPYQSTTAIACLPGLHPQAQWEVVVRDAAAAEKHPATLEDEETVGRLLQHMKASERPPCALTLAGCCFVCWLTSREQAA